MLQNWRWTFFDYNNTVYNVMLFMEYKRHFFTWKYICECAGRGQEGGRMHHIG